MKAFFRMLAGPFFIGSLLLISLSPLAGAAPTDTPKPFHLPLSPLSGGVLMAQAIHTGLVQIPRRDALTRVNPNLTCKPAPCVLPNVQASGGNGSNIVNEIPIAANPKNAKQLLTGGNDYNCSSLQGFYASSDGGSTWNHTCMNTLSGASGDGDPGVGYDLHGSAYITGIDNFGSTWSIVFEKSTDNGKTWSAPAVAVSPLPGFTLTDKDWLQIDDNAVSPHANSLYISTTQFDASNNSTIAVAHSSDGGATWNNVAVDTKQNYPTSVDQFSDLAIGKNGTVYATWMRCPATNTCAGTNATFYVSKSTDGGNTWSKPTVIGTANLAPGSCGFYGCLPNTSERVSDIPATDIDNSSGPNAGHLYTVMYNWTGAFMQVQVTTSTDNGNTWGKPVPVAPASDKHDQFFPWLTVSAKGIVGVTWLDRRNDPGNLSYEAFATLSTNGKTFRKNVKIASKPSNPLNDGFGGGFMGDYTGNVWVAGTLYASWMDSRNSANMSSTGMQAELGGYKKNCGCFGEP